MLNRLLNIRYTNISKRVKKHFEIRIKQTQSYLDVYEIILHLFTTDQLIQ